MCCPWGSLPACCLQSLEEVALKQTGDDDEVDDFEDFVFGHFFGDKALKKRWELGMGVGESSRGI